jgi:acetyl-CoA carboxylase carboxyltransferase component
MATGEVVEAEALGGAIMHSTVTGLSDQLAIDEYDPCSYPATTSDAVCAD